MVLLPRNWRSRSNKSVVTDHCQLCTEKKKETYRAQLRDLNWRMARRKAADPRFVQIRAIA